MEPKNICNHNDSVVNYDSKIKEFEEYLLVKTKENNIEKAIFKLLRHVIIDWKCECSYSYSSVSKCIMYTIDYRIISEKGYNIKLVTSCLKNCFELLRNPRPKEIPDARLTDFVKPIMEERIRIIKRIADKYEQIVNSKYDNKEIRNIFIENRMLDGVIKYKIEYFEQFFDLKPKDEFELEAYRIFLDRFFFKFRIYETDIFELVNIRYEYKVREIIIGLQDKYNKKVIASKLNMSKHLYEYVRGRLGLKRKYETKNKVVEKELEYVDIDYENEENADDNIVLEDGGRTLKIHLTIDRNQKIIKLAKELFKKKHDGELFCEVCGANPYKKYGEIGKNFIEGHHQNPLCEFQHREKVNIRDIRMVCHDCHTIIHENRKSCLTVEELRDIVKKQKQKIIIFKPYKK